MKSKIDSAAMYLFITILGLTAFLILACVILFLANVVWVMLVGQDLLPGVDLNDDGCKGWEDQTNYRWGGDGYTRCD
jgi:hypothetical protein